MTTRTHSPIVKFLSGTIMFGILLFALWVVFMFVWGVGA